MARAEGVERVIYLGGLGDPHSEHLRSRAQTAATLAAEGPPLTYFRAAMVIGAGSESYRVARHLVKRLPAMITPSWLRNRTQPIAVGDVRRVPHPGRGRARTLPAGRSRSAGRTW